MKTLIAASLALTVFTASVHADERRACAAPARQNFSSTCLGKSTQNGEGFSTWTSFCKVRKPSLCCIAHENRPDGQGSC